MQSHLGDWPGQDGLLQKPSCNTPSSYPPRPGGGSAVGYTEFGLEGSEAEFQTGHLESQVTFFKSISSLASASSLEKGLKIPSL